MARTIKERLAQFAPAIAAGDEFRSRIIDAEGDAVRCADLMAEAIEMNRKSRAHEAIGRDGRAATCMEEMQSYYCMDDSRDAYLRARGSNSIAEQPSRRTSIPKPSPSPEGEG